MASITSRIQAMYQYRASLTMVRLGMPARTALTVPQTTPTETNMRITVASVPIICYLEIT
jgi:hypothetical protein